MVEIDVHGFSCPIPVVRAKKAMEENPGQAITVLVESAVSRENVSRLARSQGYTVETDEVDDGYSLHLSPPGKSR